MKWIIEPQKAFKTLKSIATDAALSTNFDLKTEKN
jgi:hypothetical protein